MPIRPTCVDDLSTTIAIFPLSGALLLPFSHRPLNVFEPRYIAMVDKILGGERLVGLIQPQDASEESPTENGPLRQIGCLGRLTHFEENGDRRYFIVLEGICRFKLIRELEVNTPYRQAEVSFEDYEDDFDQDFGADQVDRVRFLKMMRDYGEFADFEMNWEEIESSPTSTLVNFCCMVSPYGPDEKQVLLEAKSLDQRAETLIAMTEYEMARGARDGSTPIN